MNLAGLITQASIVFSLIPAFAAATTHAVRQRQLVLSITTKVVSRDWFDHRYQIQRAAMNGLTLLAICMAISGASLISLITDLTWQIAVVLTSFRFSILAVSRAGYQGWIATIIFWVTVCATPFGIVAITDAQMSMVFQPLAWPTMRIPMALRKIVGIEFTALAVVATFLIAWRHH